MQRSINAGYHFCSDCNEPTINALESSQQQALASGPSMSVILSLQSSLSTFLSCLGRETLLEVFCRNITLPFPRLSVKELQAYRSIPGAKDRCHLAAISRISLLIQMPGFCIDKADHAESCFGPVDSRSSFLSQAPGPESFREEVYHSLVSPRSTSFCLVIVDDAGHLVHHGWFAQRRRVWLGHATLD